MIFYRIVSHFGRDVNILFPQLQGRYQVTLRRPPWLAPVSVNFPQAHPEANQIQRHAVIQSALLHVGSPLEILQ